ncbi:MAG TPA: c-type cytochrome biogenesis protein CcsB [Bacteroidales bacterium]|nr:c-type cytochrome biogenesis protein CcsB [Bacteroidales bacterium]
MIKRQSFLFSSWFMGALFVIFAVSMAIATFIENDYGAQAARQLVYNTRWFEALFLLMVANFLGQIIHYRLYKPRKLTILIFHLAFILIILGAGITRYYGFEGILHLREGQTKSHCQTDQKHIQLTVKDQEGNVRYADAQKFVITKVTSDKYEEEFKVGGRSYSLEYEGYIPNASETIEEEPGGKPVIQLTASRGMMGEQQFVLAPGEDITLEDLKIGFMEEDSMDVNISYQQDSFYIASDWEITRFSMQSREAEAHSEGEKLALAPMFVYNIKGWRFVVQKLASSGVIRMVRGRPQRRDGAATNALQFSLTRGEEKQRVYVHFSNNSSTPATVREAGHLIKLDYARKKVELPFSIQLKDFILDRYPGSQSPSSYKSQVVLIDEEEGIRQPQMIYMNHILKHKGYRFYQSSYDEDERGSVLSVNHDPWGMHVTYAGYGLLFLFVLLSLLNKHSMFRQVKATNWSGPVKKGAGIGILLILAAGSLQGASQKMVVDKELSREFGKVLVQDRNGRTKPLFTMSHDVLRKVHRSNRYKDHNAMQVFLGLHFDFQRWKEEPLIKVSHSGVRDLIGITGDYASISDLVDMQANTYKLQNPVQKAYATPSAQRNKFEKELIKVDERVNICFMVISGDFFKIFPLRDNPDTWAKPKEAAKHAVSREDSLYVSNIMSMFRQAVMQGHLSEAEKYIQSVRDYQRKYTGYELASNRKIEAEVFYYRSRIFERLFPFYATTGLLLLVLMMVRIISGRSKFPALGRILIGLIALGFAFHTAGYIIRWYISGHAPMSNGYESMIFVSWVIMLAGFIFVRRSRLTLAATTILASLTLMVAHLSFMDPEITNLVPVLKSYWLTLHVSVITGSYGFLGMGAILGLIIMILYAVVNPSRHDRIIDKIRELTVINYKALTIGLYLLTIGTFLGAIWANESWGRYWGWDPKETWSLITIIVYSFVIHSRNIPGFKSLFAFNVLALFAFSSVLMTYFGVNYYLTGLHSYAGGEPVPVPSFVYISVGLLVALTVWAYRNRNRNMEIA